MFIQHFKCSNENCKFDVRLTSLVPIFRATTPEEFKLVPVSSDRKKYVTAYSSQTICWECRKIVAVVDNWVECPSCDNRDSFMKPGWACHSCNLGVILMVKDDTVCF